MKVCQQDSVYAAEREVEPGPLFTLDGAQGYLDTCLQSDWWGERFPMIAFIEVFKLPANAPRSVGAFVEGDGATEPDQGYGHLEMVPQHLTPLILLHELAHVCAAARYNSSSHDPWFCRTYLELVYQFIGCVRYAALSHAFERHDVDFDADTSGGRGIAL